MSTLLTMLACRLLGHSWAPICCGYELCTRTACPARRRVA